MNITVNTTGVKKIAQNSYVLEENIETADDLVISIPGTLTIEGNVNVGGYIYLSTAKKGKGVVSQDVIVNGNVNCHGKISGKGGFSALHGAIVAKEGVDLNGFLFCAKDLICTCGTVHATEGIKVYGYVDAINADGLDLE